MNKGKEITEKGNDQWNNNSKSNKNNRPLSTDHLLFHKTYIYIVFNLILVNSINKYDSHLYFIEEEPG